jgi:Tfp pilus assembly protein PilF
VARPFKSIFIAPLFSACYLVVGCASVPQDKPETPTVPPAVIYETGISQLEAGDYLGARASFEQAVRLDPGRTTYRNALGLANLHLGRLPQAIESFREAVRLNPKFSDAYNNLGVALAQSGEWEGAMAAFEKVLTSATYNSPEVVYQNLGWAFYNLGRYQEAEQALKSALRLNPQMALTHYTLGLVYENQQRKPDAVRSYREAIKIAADSESGRKAQERLKALAN